MTPVIGVDGCPAGWIAVIWDDKPAHRLVSRFSELLDLDAAVIAVDMPIGLPESHGRPPEREVRRRLGERQSSVFAVPARPAVMSEDYREACAINLRHSEPPRKIAKQSFHLFPKIREIDAVITPGLQSRVLEVHPELAFWAMNGERPLPLPKKTKGRPDPAGQALRRDLLRRAGFPLDLLADASYRQRDVGADDLIDACACAWSARRILEGRSLRFPSDPPRDARGLRMEINA